MRIALALMLLATTASAAERPLVAAKSEITFAVKQMGVAVHGGFKRFTAKIDLDPAKLEQSSAQISVDIASVSTGTDEGDETAIDKLWLDAAGFPQATFKSTSLRALLAGHYVATGTLSIRGKPREVTVPFTMQNQADGTTAIAGDFQINRTDFGIGGGEWNQGDLVANEVPIHFFLTLSKDTK